MSEMKAGRELDERIAREVMGHRTSRYDGPIAPRYSPLYADGYSPYRETLPNGEARNLARYSSDIAAAWKVVEKLKSRGDIVTLTYGLSEGARCEIGYHNKPRVVYAVTAPLAICLSALKAVGA